MSSIAQRIEQVRENMIRAEQRAGIRLGSVQLCAVTKFVPVERIAEAVDAGVKIVGENRAQEFQEKLTFYKQKQLQAHFIGQLQTNKVKYICGHADLIQSVDRETLLEAIEQRASSMQIQQPVLIQINIGKEPQKGGVMPDALDQLLDRTMKASHILLKGFMCVPPAVEEEQVRKYFRSMRNSFDRYRSEIPSMDTLSMGMSHDYMTAIEEGATVVRVGTAIFGPRQILGGTING